MAESYEIEKSIEDLEKQISWLENQRNTLVFSSPEEKAEADRSLAELKLRYADTVAAYRRSQTSVSSASRKYGRNWLTPLIGILILLAAVCASIFSRKAPEPSVPLPAVTSDTQLLSVDQIHLHFRDQLSYAAKGNYSLDVDKDALTITADMWEPGLNASAVNTALRDRKALNVWRDNVSQIVTISQSMQEYVANHGHDEYSVTVRLVNCEDLGQVFAAAERGAVLYDIVDATPPGEKISDPLNSTLRR